MNDSKIRPKSKLNRLKTYSAVKLAFHEPFVVYISLCVYLKEQYKQIQKKHNYIIGFRVMWFRLGHWSVELYNLRQFLFQFVIYFFRSGRILEEGGMVLHGSSNMMLVMVLESNFGMSCCRVRLLIRKDIPIYFS